MKHFFNVPSISVDKDSETNEEAPLKKVVSSRPAAYKNILEWESRKSEAIITSKSWNSWKLHYTEMGGML